MIRKIVKSILGVSAFFAMTLCFNVYADAADMTGDNISEEAAIVTSDVDEDGCIIDEFLIEEYDASGMDILDSYFQGLLSNVPDDGWTAREAIAQIGKINEDVRMLLASLLDKDADTVSITDIAELSKITDISSFMEYIDRVDAESAIEAFKMINEDTAALLEEYFDISTEEIKEMSADGLTKSEVDEVIYSINDEIHDLLLTYFIDSFENVINDELTQAEIASLLQEAGLGAVKLIGDITGVDLSEIGVDDIHDALMSLDPVITDYLSEVTGIDIRAAIDTYFNEKTTIEIEVDVEISPEISGILEKIDFDAFAEMIDPNAVEEMLEQGDESEINPLVLEKIMDSIKR